MMIRFRTRNPQSLRWTEHRLYRDVYKKNAHREEKKRSLREQVCNCQVNTLRRPPVIFLHATQNTEVFITIAWFYLLLKCRTKSFCLFWMTFPPSNVLPIQSVVFWGYLAGISPSLSTDEIERIWTFNIFIKHEQVGFRSNRAEKDRERDR